MFEVNYRTVVNIHQYSTHRYFAADEKMRFYDNNIPHIFGMGIVNDDTKISLNSIPKICHR